MLLAALGSTSNLGLPAGWGLLIMNTDAGGSPSQWASRYNNSIQDFGYCHKHIYENTKLQIEIATISNCSSSVCNCKFRSAGFMTPLDCCTTVTAQAELENVRSHHASWPALWLLQSKAKYLLEGQDTEKYSNQLCLKAEQCCDLHSRPLRKCSF